MPQWQRHLFYTKESLKTTWKLRLGALVLILLIGASTRGLWIPYIGRSLICTGELAPSDIIIVENFDPAYLLFERASQLQKAGLAPKTLVPVQASQDTEIVNPVSQGVAEVMARQASLSPWETIPIRETEPITLNAAARIRDHLAQQHVRSVMLVTPGFRSRRSSLVYRAVLDRAGIVVRCVPVFGRADPANWAATWHGIQEVSEQFLKLQYYRFYVLPFFAVRNAAR